MNISRVTTISLVLAGAVLALAYANPLSAKGNGQDCVEGDSRPKCADDPPAAGLKYRVEMDGAFVMSQLTTSDGNELLGDADFTIDRPGFDRDPPPNEPMATACSAIMDEEDQKACETWGTVFNVCDIYRIEGSDPYGPDQFTTTPGRKEKVEWVVYKFGGGVRVFFITTIQSPIDTLNPLGVVLQLTSKCAYHADHLDDFPNRTLCKDPFLPDPEDKNNPTTTTTFDMQHFWNHADGKKGVVHAQPCHVGEGELLDKDDNPSHSTLTITIEQEQE